MEKPKVIFKEPAVGYLFGGLLLLTAFLFGMVNCFSPSETQPGEVPHFVMLAFFVVSAVFFIFLGRTYTVVDENGILWGSDFGKKQYSWSDVKKVGIECRRFRSQKHGTIVLNISGKKRTLPYTKRCMQCIHAYYGAPDYDLWNQEPEKL